MPGTSIPTAFDDVALVKAVRLGNTDAFKLLVQQNEKLVLSIVFKMIAGKEDREDICQEVFLKVYEKIASFKFNAKLSTWIGNIAFNACMNHLKKKRAILLDDLYNPKEDETEERESKTTFQVRDQAILPDEQLNEKERILILMQCVDQLSPIQKTVISLFHQHELSLEEIATITNLPANTIKSHLHRGRQVLKNQLAKRLNL